MPETAKLLLAILGAALILVIIEIGSRNGGGHE